MSPRTFVTRGAALLALATLGLAACETKTIVQPPPTDVSVVVSPSSATLTAVGQKVQFVALVTGVGTGGNTAVTWASSTPAVATVDANGNVTAVANGVTSIIATSVQDPTKKAAASVTVNTTGGKDTTVAPPSVSIKSILENDGDAVDINNVSGPINITLNVDVPPGNQISSVQWQLDATTFCTQTFTTGHSAGGDVTTQAADAVEMSCQVNTAAVDPATGKPKYANGPHTLSAKLVGPSGNTAASTSQVLVFNNVNQLQLSETTTKSGTNPDGIVFRGGDVSVKVTPAIFDATVLNSITVSVGGYHKTIAVSGTGAQTVTFTQANLGSPDGAEGLVIVSASSLTTAGTAGPNQIKTDTLNLDERAPEFTGIDDETNNGFVFPTGNDAPPFWYNASSLLTLQGLMGPDAGEEDGGVDNDVVTIKTIVGTDTATATTIAALGQHAAGTAKAKVTICDAFQNCRSLTSPAFGVDLVAPQLTVVAGPADKAVNPATAYQFLVADTGVIGTVVSGIPAGAFKIKVVEFIPAGNKCYDVVAATQTAVPTGGCVPVDAGVAGVDTYQFSLAATEAYDSVVVFAVDSAGNKSNTVSRIALVDTHAPTIAGITSPATITGGTAVAFSTNVADNIDLWKLSGTQTFSDGSVWDLGAATLDAFGLPETTTATAALTVSPFITSLQYTTANVPTGASFNATAIALTVSDWVPLTATRSLDISANVSDQSAFNWTAAPTNLSSFTFTATGSPTTLVHPVTVTMKVAAVVPNGQATPFASVRFYELTAPALTFLNSVAGNTGFISETVTLRTITYTSTVSIPTAGTHTYFAVGVDASGHGVVSGIVTITVT